MRLRHFRQHILVSGAVMGLTACGGGGGGSGFVTPPPPVTPPDSCSSTPCPPPPPPTHNIGLQSSNPFPTFSVYKDSGGNLVSGDGAVQISYAAATDTYTVTLPGFQQGNLITTSANGSFDGDHWTHVQSTNNAVTAGDSTDLQSATVTLDYAPSSDYKYTGFGRWQDPQFGTLGLFVYGIPTAAGDVPVTGDASYAGDIHGLTNDNMEVFGTINLQFDFGAGTLSGVMSPEVAPVWDAVSLGNYTFRDTVYSRGSTNFSGAFNLPGSLTGSSSFHGQFTGPSAAELMGSWTAPYVLPGGSTPGTMTGVFGGRKGP
jgi:hypothetical protein